MLNVIRMKYNANAFLHILAGVLFILLLLPSFSLAAGPVHGAKAGGMGTAFSAVADDGSAIAFNPAGLINVRGAQVYGGGTAVFPSTRYENPAGQSESTEFKVFFPPYLYLSQDFGFKDMVFGLGFFSPFGIGGRYWSEDGLTRYISTENTIATFSVNPVMAWQILPWVAVGGGPYYMLVKNTGEKMMDQTGLSWSDAKFRMDGDGDGFGYSLGALIVPVKQWSIGLCYRSSVKVDLDGTARINNIAPPLQSAFGGTHFKTDVSTSVDLPQVATLGIAWMPTDNLTIAMDIDWSDWSCFNEQDIDFKTEVPAVGFTDITVPMDWKDSYVIGVGFDMKMNSKLSLRGGYAYGNNPVPDETLSPASPDANQQSVSIGIGYRLRDNIVIDAFYLVEFLKTRVVQNTILSGTYDNICHFTGVGLGYRF
jgi:long-chain fatty acid transport protein